MKRRLTWIILLCISTGAASANPALCNAIAMVERVLTAQQRLSALDEFSFATPDVILLINHLKRTDPDYVTHLLPASTRLSHGGMISEFLYETQYIVSRLTAANFDVARRELRAAAHQRRMDQMIQIIPSYDCPVDIEPHMNAGASRQQNGTNANQGANSFDLPAIGVLIALIAAGAGLGIVLIKAMQRWALLRRRRSKRFVTNIVTKIRLENGLFRCKINDLSCTGAKLSGEGAKELISAQHGAILVGDYWADCKNAWSNDHFSGVQFNRPLPINIVRDVTRSKK